MKNKDCEVFIDIFVKCTQMHKSSYITCSKFQNDILKMSFLDAYIKCKNQN